MTPKTLTCALALMLSANIFMLAQAEEQPGPQPPEGVETRLYEVKHQDVADMAALLDGFIRGYHPTLSEHFNTLTVSAPEGVHAAVRALIEQYDKPPRSIDLKIYLLKGKRVGTDAPQALPEAIGSIVAEIASLTEFKNFELIASPQVRTLEGHGVNVNGGKDSPHEIVIGNLRLQSGERLQVQKFRVYLHAGGRRSNVSLGTSFEIDDGETVVLGTSEMDGGRGEALVTLVTARLVK